MKFEVTEAGVYEKSKNDAGEVVDELVEIGTILDLGDVDDIPARLVGKGRVASAVKKEVKVEAPKAAKPETSKPAAPPKPPAK